MKKIVLYGVSTFKNRGVEAIVNSTINQIDLNKYQLTAGSYDLEYNKKFYKDKIKYVNHNKKDSLNEEEKELEKKYQDMPFDYNNFELLYQGDVVKEMEDADICISVGGDNYCYVPASWLYALDNKSRQLGKKTVLWGSSLFEEINDVDLINNLNNFDVLVIRESLTLDAVKKYIDEDKIIYAPDPAFSMKTKEIKLNKWYKNRDYVILNVSPLTIKNDVGYQAVINLMKHILKDTEYSICLLAHVTTEDCNDLDILTKLKNEFKKEERVYLEEGEYDCEELKYIISKSKITVAARTHASIAAYSTCVPTLVIGYSVKSKGIAKDLFGEYENYVIDSKKITTPLFIEKFDYINKNKKEITKILKQQMPSIKEKASHIFDKVIEKLDEQEQKRICEKKKCLGCGLCASICPVNAIEMKEDRDGFIYPDINLDKCIHCNKCRNICPALKDKEKEFKREYYAIKNKNLEERKASTSGGLFSILSKKILNEKGIVYGCFMQDNNAVHIRIDNVDDLYKIRGSKYNQSNISNIFTSIKEDLKNNKKVLFSGTPCQIGVIKNLIGDNDNLITTSVVCHGVINNKILNKYLEDIEKINNKKVTDWHFRAKTTNSWKRSSVSYKLDSKLVTKDFIEDDLMYLYLNNLILRECCYECNYKDRKNTADLIIADYWGIEVTNPDFFDDNGVSALVINSENGKKFFDEINKEEIDYISGSEEDIEKYNPSFFKPVEKPKNRRLILSNIYELPIQLVSSKVRIEKLKTKEEKLNIKQQELIQENKNLNNKLQSIYSSKRWKITDKIFNIINKILRRK